MDNATLEGVRSELESIAPSSVQEYVSDFDVQSVSWDSVYRGVLDATLGALSVPIDLMVSLAVCILLTALVQSLSGVSRDRRVYTLVGVLVCVRVTVQPVLDAVENVKEVMLSSAMYMDSYAPILSSIMLANGQVTASAGYGATTYLCCQAWVAFAESVVLPLMSVSLAIACVGSVCSELRLGGLVRAIERATHWAMSVAMLLFSGVVTLQSAVASSGDRVSSKALKFVVSNGVPIVGSAVSDACETVRSSLELLRSGVGVLGIAVVLIDVLPPIVNVGVLRMVVSLGETLADVFAADSLRTFLAGVSSVLSAVFSCAVCFAVTFVVSIGAVVLMSSV